MKKSPIWAKLYIALLIISCIGMFTGDYLPRYVFLWSSRIFFILVGLVCLYTVISYILDFIGMTINSKSKSNSGDWPDPKGPGGM